MRNMNKTGGFTYTEVLLTLPLALVSILAAAGVMINAMSFNESSRGYTQAMNLAIWRLEEIRKQATVSPESFSTVMAAYDGRRYPLLVPPDNTEPNALRALGVDPLKTEVVTRVESLSIGSYPSNLVNVTAVVCYRDKNERIIGEDKNFNGTLEISNGEDTNGNGKLDSPVMFHVLIARK